MYKSYYKQGYQPATKYRKAQRYIKSRVAQNIATNRGAMITRPIVYRKSADVKGMDTSIGTVVQTLGSNTGTNTDIICMNLIQMGNGSWNRVGKKVCLKSLRLLGTVTLRTISPNNSESNAFRMCVVWDKQPSGNTIPIFSEIFGRTVQNGAESSQIYDPIRYDNSGRFKILLERKYEMNIGYEAANGGSSNYIKHIDEFLDLKNRETIFSGQSVPMTIADVSTGALYIVFRANIDSLVSEITVNDNFMSRLRYTD